MPSSPQPVTDLLAALQGALAALGVRWFLFGAQAAILYGVVRLSADVDVTVDLGKRPATDLVAALAAAGFDLRIPDAAGLAEATRVLPFVHRASRMPLDVVLRGRSGAARRRRAGAGGLRRGSGDDEDAGGSAA